MGRIFGEDRLYEEVAEFFAKAFYDDLDLANDGVSEVST